MSEDEYNEYDASYEDIESSTSEEARAKLIEKAMEILTTQPEQLTKFTDLSLDEIKRLSVLATLSEITNSRALKLFLVSYLEMKISYKRKGREEIIEALQETTTNTQGWRARLEGVL